MSGFKTLGKLEIYSRYRKGYNKGIVREEIGTRCPDCDNILPLLEHTKQYICICSTNLIAYGNILMHWKPTEMKPNIHEWYNDESIVDK